MKAVAPARLRPRATIAKEARVSRRRFIWIDMRTKFFLLEGGRSIPVALSDVDNA